jgi:hypothetical protein
MLSDDSAGEPLRMRSMVRFCFNRDLEDMLKDDVVDYGGIKVIVKKRTEEEKIERFAELYAQAQWMIGHITMMESKKLKEQLMGNG